jgi:hypothetical protein
MADTKRIEIGFVGQQVITLKVDSDQLETLRGGLDDGGWQTVTTDEGEVDVDLGKVAFVRVAAGHGSVGFGSSE